MSSRLRWLLFLRQPSLRQPFLQLPSRQRPSQQQLFQPLLMEAERRTFEIKDKVVALQIEDAQNHAECLGRNGSNGSTQRTHIEHGYQQKIQPDIHHAGDGNKDQRVFAVAHAAHHGRKSVVTEDENGAQHGYKELILCLAEGGFRCLDQPKQRLLQKYHYRSDYHAQNDQRGEQGAYGLF